MLICDVNLISAFELRNRKPHGDLYSEYDKNKRTGAPTPIPDRPIITHMTDRRLTLAWKPSVPTGPRFPVTYQVCRKKKKIKITQTFLAEKLIILNLCINIFRSNSSKCLKVIGSPFAPVSVAVNVTSVIWFHSRTIVSVSVLKTNTVLAIPAHMPKLIVTNWSRMYQRYIHIWIQALTSVQKHHHTSPRTLILKNHHMMVTHKHQCNYSHLFFSFVCMCVSFSIKTFHFLC